jgi:hypothetical protein
MLLLFFWVVMLCGLIGRYKHYRETYRLHLQGLLSAVVPPSLPLITLLLLFFILSPDLPTSLYPWSNHSLSTDHPSSFPWKPFSPIHGPASPNSGFLKYPLESYPNPLAWLWISPTVHPPVGPKRGCFSLSWPSPPLTCIKTPYWPRPSSSHSLTLVGQIPLA